MTPKQVELYLRQSGECVACGEPTAPQDMWHWKRELFCSGCRQHLCLFRAKPLIAREEIVRLEIDALIDAYAVAHAETIPDPYVLAR